MQTLLSILSYFNKTTLSTPLSRNFIQLEFNNFTINSGTQLKFIYFHKNHKTTFESNLYTPLNWLDKLYMVMKCTK